MDRPTSEPESDSLVRCGSWRRAWRTADIGAHTERITRACWEADPSVCAEHVCGAARLTVVATCVVAARSAASPTLVGSTPPSASRDGDRPPLSLPHFMRDLRRGIASRESDSTRHRRTSGPPTSPPPSSSTARTPTATRSCTPCSTPSRRVAGQPSPQTVARALAPPTACARPHDRVASRRQRTRAWSDDAARRSRRRRRGRRVRSPPCARRPREKGVRTPPCAPTSRETSVGSRRYARPPRSGSDPAPPRGRPAPSDGDPNALAAGRAPLPPVPHATPSRSIR